jgi:hypothetical protein
MREIVSSMYALMLQIDERNKAFNRKITAIFKASQVASELPRSAALDRRPRRR